MRHDLQTSVAAARPARWLAKRTASLTSAPIVCWPSSARPATHSARNPAGMGVPLPKRCSGAAGIAPRKFGFAHSSDENARVLV